MSIYIVHRRKKNASNALNVPSTDQNDTSSVYDESSQFACLAHANCFGTSSMSLVQRQRRCDGRTYRAETMEQRVDGSWRNEDAVVQQLERPVCTAQTDNPVPGQYVTRSATSSQCSSEWWSRCVKSWSYFFVPLTTRAAAQNADSVTNLVEKMRRIDEFSGPDGMSAGLTQQWLLTADCSTPW